MSTKVSKDLAQVSLTAQPSLNEGPLEFLCGQLIGKNWIFERKVNEGGFGAVYEVKHVKKPGRFAMKLSLASKKDMDKLMAIEIGVLRKLSGKAPCFPKYEDTGVVKGYRFAVMELLGDSLADLQDSMPSEKFSLHTVIRVGLQMLTAIETMHDIYYLHRDIKPGNVAVGYNNRTRIYLFDFGLARHFVEFDYEKKRLRIRGPRSNAPFRGTYHYCSPHQHENQDTCRRDDLWSLMYTLIEFRTRILPWEHEKDKYKIAKWKRNTPVRVLLQGCPVLFEQILIYLDRLEYYHRPSYDFIRRAFDKILRVRRLDPNAPYDWEVPRPSAARKDKHRVSLKAVFDGFNNTVNATKMSLGSECSSSEGSTIGTNEEEIEGDLIPSRITPPTLKLGATLPDLIAEYINPDPRHK